MSVPEHTPSPPARKRSSGPRDLLVVGLVVAAVFGLGLAFDVFDLVGDLIVDWVYLDEFVALSLMLIVGLSIVALRRSAQATRERALRQDTEATAARTEARFRTIVERVPAVAYVWDSAAEASSAPALYISPQLESLLGYTAEEWLADPQAHARCIHPDDADRVYTAWADAVKDADVFATEYRLQRADGRWVWIRDEANPVGTGPSGHQIYQGVLFDITERREAEQRLRDLEHRWRTLLESLPVTAFTIEYDLDAPDRSTAGGSLPGSSGWSASRRRTGWPTVARGQPISIPMTGNGRWPNGPPRSPPGNRGIRSTGWCTGTAIRSGSASRRRSRCATDACERTASSSM